jgi:hypothetical protein
MHMGLPVRVQGHDTDGTTWTEMAMTEDAYWGGAGFMLRHPVVKGNALLLSLPLPKQFRRYDLANPSYLVYALVRHTLVTPAGGVRVGVMFLGKNPPRGYDLQPSGRFLLPSDSEGEKAARERRRTKRHELAVNISLRTASGEERREYTISRNVGTGGMEVMTTLALGTNDHVVIEEIGGSFHAEAQVRQVHIGADKVPRLNLSFLDAAGPAGMRDLLKRNGIFE